MLNNNKSEQIQIYGKQSNINVKNFDSIEEFQQYYNLHKDEIDKTTTTKLNRMFKIKDYKITRRKIGDNDGKTLCFQQIKSNQNKNVDKDAYEEYKIELCELENTISELNSKMKNIELKFEQSQLEINKIKKQMVEIINAINGSN